MGVRIIGEAVIYDELYRAWRRERESGEIQPLPRDFLAKLASYVKKLKEESRMLDKRTIKARLMQREFENARRMIEDLLKTRYEKVLRKALVGETVPKESLTREEELLHRGIQPSLEAYQSLIRSVLEGRPPQVGEGETPKPKPNMMVVRFLREVPAIMGLDMRTYGPFKPEDIAALPIENAKALIKQGVAVQVEVE